jgi:hypothetical protein
MLHARRGTIAALLLIACVTSSAQAFAGRGSLKGPYLTGLSDTGVVVRFELASPAAATVQVTRAAAGTPAAAARTFESRDVVSLHEVPAAGLEPGVAYSYVVRSGGKSVGEGRFTTAPKPGAAAPLNFLVYGDDRTDTAAHSAVVHAMEQVPCDFVINTGDLVEDGASDGDWQSFFDVEAALLRNHPLFASVGNHELHHDPSGAKFLGYVGFRDERGTPRFYGTVRLGNVRFFFLNAGHPWDAGEERQWLERELTRADAEAGLVWRMVVVHDGPWSAGPHGPSEKLASGRVPELLAAHTVDFLFSGHDHTYQRGDAAQIKYVVSGGAGAPLYAITRNLPSTRKALSTYHFVEVRTNGDAMEIVARRPDGTEIDRCGFYKGGAWDCDAPPSAPAPSAQAPEPSPPPPPSRRGCDVRGTTALPGRDPGTIALAAIGVLGVSLARRLHRRG